MINHQPKRITLQNIYMTEMRHCTRRSVLSLSCQASSINLVKIKASPFRIIQNRTRNIVKQIVSQGTLQKKWNKNVIHPHGEHKNTFLPDSVALIALI